MIPSMQLSLLNNHLEVMFLPCYFWQKDGKPMLSLGGALERLPECATCDNADSL